MDRQKSKITFIVLLNFIVLAYNAYGETDIFRTEANLLGGYSSEDRWIGEREMVLKNSVGFEYFKKFASDYGDRLTLDLQMRAAYNTQETSDDAWGIEVHNAWLEYKLGLGSALRFGHFDPAFGLEATVDTHATLLQTLAMLNVGFKKDWGIAYTGYAGPFDYEISATLGSGMSLRHKDDSYLLAGRMTQRLDNNFTYGFSLLYGQVLKAVEMQTIPVPQLISEDATRKSRIGFDVIHSVGLLNFKAEAAFGWNDHTAETAGALLEAGFTHPRVQELGFKVQSRFWQDDLSRRGTRRWDIGTVAEYTPIAQCSVRLGFFHEFYAPRDAEDSTVLLQIYFYG